MFFGCSPCCGGGACPDYYNLMQGNQLFLDYSVQVSNTIDGASFGAASIIETTLLPVGEYRPIPDASGNESAYTLRPFVSGATTASSEFLPIPGITHDSSSVLQIGFDILYGRRYFTRAVLFFVPCGALSPSGSPSLIHGFTALAGIFQPASPESGGFSFSYSYSGGSATFSDEVIPSFNRYYSAAVATGLAHALLPIPGTASPTPAQLTLTNTVRRLIDLDGLGPGTDTGLEVYEQAFSITVNSVFSSAGEFIPLPSGSDSTTLYAGNSVFQ